jgi:hypothetical protein
MVCNLCQLCGNPFLARGPLGMDLFSFSNPITNLFQFYSIRNEITFGICIVFWCRIKRAYLPELGLSSKASELMTDVELSEQVGESPGCPYCPWVTATVTPGIHRLCIVLNLIEILY